MNVNKIALLRNSRGQNMPDVVDTALKCLRFGAHGITVHPRPDGRHITYQDVIDLKHALPCELNVEGYPSEDFLRLVLDVKPAQVTLVPDPPDALTSSFGWDISRYEVDLNRWISQFRTAGIRSSIFLDPTVDDLSPLSHIQPDRVELYTYDYAHQFDTNKYQAIRPYQDIAARIVALDIGLNAGHDLNSRNLAFFLQGIPAVQEVSIGHALICEALDVGLEQCIQTYLNCL